MMQIYIEFSRPPPSRKVSLGSLIRNLNYVIMINHFYLVQLRFFMQWIDMQGSQ